MATVAFELTVGERLSQSHHPSMLECDLLLSDPSLLHYLLLHGQETVVEEPPAMSLGPVQASMRAQ